MSVSKCLMALLWCILTALEHSDLSDSFRSGSLNIFRRTLRLIKYSEANGEKERQRNGNRRKACVYVGESERLKKKIQSTWSQVNSSTLLMHKINQFKHLITHHNSTLWSEDDVNMYLCMYNYLVKKSCVLFEWQAGMDWDSKTPWDLLI